MERFSGKIFICVKSNDMFLYPYTELKLINLRDEDFLIEYILRQAISIIPASLEIIDTHEHKIRNVRLKINRSNRTLCTNMII